MGGRYAVIQGASGGLGFAMTRQLLAQDNVERVFATCRHLKQAPKLEELSAEAGGRLEVLELDLRDPASTDAASERIQAATDRLHLIVNCAGVLHGEGLAPEKRLESVEFGALQHAFEVNAFGPLLLVRGLLPRVLHSERAVIANLSARVGSIQDNRAGGWYAYRASKAAQNMFTKTLALELKRRAPNCICVALHPGTVDTALSKPFQRGRTLERLFSAERAAGQLLDIVDALLPEQSGSFLAWDGSEIPW